MRAIWVALVTLSLVLDITVQAQDGGVFTATAAIEDQSSRELAQGSEKALLSLLRSLTLETDPAKLEPILTRSQTLLKQSIFLGVEETLKGTQQLVSFDFDAQAVTQAIFAAGLGVVPKDRPRPLLWWVVNDEQGVPRYLDGDRDSSLIAAYRVLLSEFGLDFDLPLYDLADTLAVSANALWEGRSLQIARGMLRYQPQPQRLVKWAKLSEGRVFLSVSLMQDGRLNVLLEQIFSSESLALDSLIETHAHMVRSELAVVADDADLPPIMIEGLRDFDDYRRITLALEANVFVESVRVVRLNGDRLTLSVESPASIDQFTQILRQTLDLEYLGADEQAIHLKVKQ